MSCRLQRNSRNSGSDMFFGGDSLSFVFRSSHLTVFKSFIPFGIFLLKKQDSLTPPNSFAKSATAKTTWLTLLPLGIWPLLLEIASFAEYFLHMVTPTCPPHILWTQSCPHTIIWALAGLRKCTAGSYRTPCTFSRADFGGKTGY
jgi:hypothetical protein